METGEVAKVNRPTLEELAMAVACTPTPTPMPIYSITVSVPTATPIPTTPGSLMPTPVPVCSMELSVPQVPTFPTPIPTFTNFNSIFLNTTHISYAFGQFPHLSLTAREEDLGQSTPCAQAPISCPILAPIQPFNIQLDSGDMDFLRKKSGDAQERHKNILLKAGQPNLNVTIVAALRRGWHDGSAMAFNKPLQKQLQADRER